jgi:uncharacterized protein (TIGR03437 family)
MKVVPGVQNSIVISRRYNGLSPDYAGTAAYDNGVIRQKVTPTHTGSRKFAFGGSAAVLWGLVSGFGMQRLTLDSSGVSIASGNQFSADINGASGNDIKFDGGLYYLDSGTVVDPNLRSAVGKFAGSGPIQPDSTRGRAFIMSGSTGGIPTLQSFDLKTYVPFGSLPVPDSIGSGLLRWGTNGIAMQGGASYYFDTTNTGKLFIFRTPMADAAPSVAAGAITNAASQMAGPIAPGEILSIYGSQLGPAAGAGLKLDRVGHVANTLAGVQVLFDSTPGTLTYVGSNQINVIAPYSIGRKSSVSVVVTNMGIPSQAATMQVVAASPAVFTADGSGKGAGAILNQDGSPNSASNPASAGSVIMLFGTGEGLTNPAGTDGNVTTGTPASLPVTPLTATVDGMDAAVQYASAAPGLVSGVFQMNITIPAEAHRGSAVPVVVKSGSASSPSVTVAVK